MSFISPEFCYLVLIFFSIYWYLKPHKTTQKYFLTVTSYLFYASWSIKFTGILLVYSALIWLLGKWIRAKDSTKTIYRMKVSLIISLSLSLLFITKYYAFFRELILEALVDVGIQQPLPLLDIIIPAGISFFTFQAITYLVWQKNTEESGDLKQKITFVDLLLYLAFWPTLFAGPIFRARDFFTQLYADSVGKPLNTEKAIFFILLGLFQKVVLSHWLAITFVEEVFTDPEKQNILTVSSGAWAYALQIFFDFSGYSLLVTGLGLLMGFQIPINFKQPYLAKNLQDFWKRWHISLSTFIRDYIYIPLGGNQGSFARTQINIVIAMTLSGIWHGANLTFLIWGVLHALGVVLINVNQNLMRINFSETISRVITIVFICFAWVFFRSETLDQALLVLQKSLNVSGTFTSIHLQLLVLTIIFFKLSSRAELIETWCVKKITQYWGWRLFLMITMMVYLIIFAGPTGVPAFIYYRF